MRSDDCGNAELRGLKGVVAAGDKDASADDGYGRERIYGSQFADGVEKEDRARGERRGCGDPLRAANVRQVSTGQQRGDGVEPLRMARREDCDDSGRKRVEQEFLFAGKC